jgi:hypothetical protein
MNGSDHAGLQQRMERHWRGRLAGRVEHAADVLLQPFA